MRRTKKTTKTLMLLPH